MDKELKKQWYQALFNGWKVVVSDKDFIIELREFCDKNEWEYEGDDFQIYFKQRS